MRVFKSVLPILFVFLCMSAFGQYSRYTGMVPLGLSTNFVIAARHSNVVAVASVIGVSTITVTNATTASDSITNNSLVRSFGAEFSPTTIKVGADGNAAATNIYLSYTLYPQSGIVASMTETNVVVLTGHPYGPSVSTASSFADEISNTTGAYTSPAVIDTTQTDNLTLQLYAQGSAASTDKIIFQFAGGDGTNWDSTLINSSVTLSGPTLVYAVTNLGVVNWPFLKLVTVTNVSAVNLTNFGVRYGYKY